MKPGANRIAALMAVLVCGLLLTQCGDDNPTEPDNLTGTIDDNVRSLSHMTQSDPFAERAVGDRDTVRYTVGDKTFVCEQQLYEAAPEFDEQLTLNPTTDVIWPGAIIDGATIETGEYTPIIAKRAPLTFSISLINIAGKKSKTVQNPMLSTMREAIAEILDQEVTGGTAAQVTFVIEDVYSEKQLDVALGVTYKSGLYDVKSQFDFSRQEVSSRLLVKFLQVYYTLDIDLPENPSDLFDPSVTWPELAPKISGNVSPMYVSSISYGRMALFCMESSRTATDVRAALDASFKAIDTDVSLETEYQEVLDQTTIKATIIGGSGKDAVQAVNGFDGLKEYMTQGGDYDKSTPGAPLAYKLRYLSDNDICRICMANEYWVRTCNELMVGHYGVAHRGAYVAWFYVYYNLYGEDKSVYSGKYTAGFNRSLEVPMDATDIAVLVREDTGVGYRTIFRYPASGGNPRPEVKCWKITGTTLSPKYSEITCDF
jgi:thiol-activated cytolysin